MREFLSITKALSDENRVRILMALSTGELCVCQIIELLNLAPSTVSKHMSILKQARLIEGEKNGKWVYYKLAGDTPQIAADAIDWARKHLVSEAKINSDTKNLKTIIKQHPVETCKQQKKSRAARVVDTRTVTVKATS